MQNTIVSGIPISQLLKQMADHGEGEERHKFHPITIHGTDRTEEDAINDEREYLKSVEKDFSGMAGDILERLNLSHLRRK